MDDEEYRRVQREIREILAQLSERERKLLSEVVRIERENLHIKHPALKTELLAKVKEVIK